MKKDLSSKLTFFYKYIISSIFVLFNIFILSLIFNHKIYPFLIFLIPFIIVGLYQLKIIFKLKKVYLNNNRLEIDNMILKKIKEIKIIRSFFVQIILSNGEKIYFLPKLNYIFSNGTRGLVLELQSYYNDN